MPAKCIRKRPLTGSQNQSSCTIITAFRSQFNGHYEPNIQLSVSTSKPDHIAKLLEAIKKMTEYFKKTHHNSMTVTTPVQTSTTQLIQTYTNANLTTQVIMLMKLLVKHIHLKTLNQKLKIKTPMILTVWIVTLTPLQTQSDYYELTKLLRSS